MDKWKMLALVAAVVFVTGYVGSYASIRRTYQVTFQGEYAILYRGLFPGFARVFFAPVNLLDRSLFGGPTWSEFDVDQLARAAK